ncbi:uncharacterized protein LOC143854653 [Tasmannia lanceolata]|uniref:uncharacterized protein LOC143854653 n=1 Tax=Tasmannia lanceolata TaxID=3420 RepID=UPI00406349E4
MMASACLNNIGMSSENLLNCPPYSSYGWLSPRISFSHDGTKISGEKEPENPVKMTGKPDQETDLGDFEFRLEDPVTMLPADELFLDGKLLPTQHATVHRTADPDPDLDPTRPGQIRLTEAMKSRRRVEVLSLDPYVFSPKAPRCSSRWRELLGLKRLQSPKQDLQKTSSLSLENPNPKSLKHFLHRNSKSLSNDSSLSLPLLRESESESVSISSRLSLSSSSSSSGPDHEDLPRLSLDLEKPTHNPTKVRVSNPRIKVRNPRPFPDHPTSRNPAHRAPDSGMIPGVSADSPRMNSSGKIVFQSLERSSSSPSSFNGGPRHKIRGVERSYSANVRITPVLNVPVSVFGFGQLFSPQKKDALKTHYSKNRNDRI